MLQILLRNSPEQYENISILRKNYSFFVPHLKFARFTISINALILTGMQRNINLINNKIKLALLNREFALLYFSFNCITLNFSD